MVDLSELEATADQFEWSVPFIRSPIYVPQKVAYQGSPWLPGPPPPFRRRSSHALQSCVITRAAVRTTRVQSLQPRSRRALFLNVIASSTVTTMHTPCVRPRARGRRPASTCHGATCSPSAANQALCCCCRVASSHAPDVVQASYRPYTRSKPVQTVQAVQAVPKEPVQGRVVAVVAAASACRVRCFFVAPNFLIHRKRPFCGGFYGVCIPA